MQITTCRYRGDKIEAVASRGRSMTVHVYDWRGVIYYHTAAPNLQVALMYAQNAVHYHHDGEGTWPGGLPLIAKSSLPETTARRRARLGLRTLWVDGRVQDYLDQKAED